jgi:hypothetical protein
VGGIGAPAVVIELLLGIVIGPHVLGLHVSQFIRRAGRCRSSTVSLLVAEAPQWRGLTSIRGSSAQASVPFRIRGTHFRVRYSMGYQGTCTLLLICSGPSAEVANLSNGTTAAGFDLNDGGAQTRVVQSGPGVYQLKVSPGSDTARWSIEVQDYY